MIFGKRTAVVGNKFTGCLNPMRAKSAIYRFMDSRLQGGRGEGRLSEHTRGNTPGPDFKRSSA